MLVDGRRPAGRVNDAFDLTRIPASQVERIEITKGAASVLYGSDAIGGVVNIITRRLGRGKSGWQAGVGATSGSGKDQAMDGNAGAGSQDAGLRVDASLQRGPAFDLDGATPSTTGSAYENVRASLLLIASPRDSLDIEARYDFERQLGDGIASTGGGAVIDQPVNMQGQGVSVESGWRVDPDNRLRASAAVSRTEDVFAEDQRGGFQLDRRDRTAESTREASLIYSRALDDENFTDVGLEFLEQEMRSDRLGSRQGSRERKSTFLQHEWQPAFRLPFFLVPGLRYDDDSQFGNHFTKKVAARIDPVDGLVIRASYGDGFRAPGFRELLIDFENPGVGYRVEGNPGLRPEISRSLQLSAAVELGPSWLSLGVFDNRIRDLIVASPGLLEGRARWFTAMKTVRACIPVVLRPVGGKPGRGAGVSALTIRFCRRGTWMLPGRSLTGQCIPGRS